MQRKKRFNKKPVYRYTLSAVCCLLILTGLMNAHDVADSKYGVCAHVNGTNIITRLHHANASWVRMDFLWDEVQPTIDYFLDGRYDWDGLNTLINPARMNDINISIYATIQGVPRWASGGDKKPPTRSVIYTDPVTQEEFTGVQAWQRFVYEAIMEYGVKKEENDKIEIFYWGIENEPDDSSYNGTRSEYVYDMLIPAAEIIRSAGPHLKICAPDLMESLDFLDYVLRWAGQYVDIVTVHSYGSVPNVMSELDNYVMHACGRPVWLTETGRYECNGDIGREQLQALWYYRFFKQFNARNDVSKVFTYDAYDPPNAVNEFYGIMYCEANCNQQATEESDPIILRPAYHEYRWVAGSNDAQFVASPDPFTVPPGKTFYITLTVKNTGTLSWDETFKYRLGYLSSTFYPNFTEDTDLGVKGMRFVHSDDVEPGESCTFDIGIVAPSDPDNYFIVWQMYQDIKPASDPYNVRWFGQTKYTHFIVGQKPYHDSPFSIPGRIEAEDYDLGGEGLAYHDTTPTNICNPALYRDEGVDIQLAFDAGGGYNVGYIEPTEWLEYTVYIPGNLAQRIFDIKVRVAAPGGGSFRIELDGNNITGNRSFKATGGSQVWKTVVIPGIQLPTGEHILKFHALQPNFNLNWIEIALSQQGPYVTHTIPGKIQAEDYDTGGQGIAYNDTTPTNDCYYKAYRFEGVDVENSPVSGPITINVGYIYSGEWLEYTVEVPVSRNYQLNIRAAAPEGGALSLETDGMPLTGTINIPRSNLGPQNYTIIPVPAVYLPKGKMVIRINMLGNLFNLDYIELL